MSTVELIDHLTTIWFDIVMPAIGVWAVYMLRKVFAEIIGRR